MITLNSIYHWLINKYYTLFPKKYHGYHFVFLVVSDDGYSCSTVTNTILFERRVLIPEDLRIVKEQCGYTSNTAIVNFTYLGSMTREDFDYGQPR